MMPEMYKITCEFVLNVELEEEILDEVEEKINELISRFADDLAEQLLSLKKRLIKVKILKGDVMLKKK